MGTAGAGNIAQRLPHVRLIHRWIEEIVDPAQWVHGIGDIVQPTLSPVVAQRTVDPFGGQHFTEMSNVVFP